MASSDFQDEPPPPPRVPYPDRERQWPDEPPPGYRPPPGDATGGLIPYKNPNALIAYYLGVFGLVPCLGLILGPFALILGIQGVRYANRNPTARGLGHAVTGIVLGSLEILGNWGTLIVFGAALLFAPR
jgi:hypothetical protein